MVVEQYHPLAFLSPYALWTSTFFKRILLDRRICSHSLHLSFNTVFLVVLAKRFWIFLGNDPYPAVFLFIRRSPCAALLLFPALYVDITCAVCFLHRGQYLFNSPLTFIVFHQSMGCATRPRVSYNT